MRFQTILTLIAITQKLVAESGWSLPEPTWGTHRGGGQDNLERYGRVSDDEYRMTPEQIEEFRREGCVTIKDVLTEDEVVAIERVFDGFMSGTIPPPPGKRLLPLGRPWKSGVLSTACCPLIITLLSRAMSTNDWLKIWHNSSFLD